MTDRMSIDAIREFAEMTRDHSNELIYSEYVLALVEVVEAVGRDVVALERWAAEQYAENPFADQVRQRAMSWRHELAARFDFSEL